MALQLQPISTPLSSGRRITTFPSSKSPRSVRIHAAVPVKVKMVAERKDSLDHLQRPNNHQQQQFQTRRTPDVTSTGLWNRFPSAKTVQQMMDTMEDPYLYAWTPSSENVLKNGSRTPWAIKEGEKDYKMRFDMPGMTKNDVKVWVEEKMLVVKAKKESVNENAIWDAKSYGKYGFRIALPENIEFEKIGAEVKDGVLYINVPKASIGTKILDINVQ